MAKKFIHECYKAGGEIPVHIPRDAGSNGSNTGKYFHHVDGVFKSSTQSSPQPQESSFGVPIVNHPPNPEFSRIRRGSPS